MPFGLRADHDEVEIVFGPRTYRLETENTDERRAWIHALQDARQGAAAAKLRQSQAGEDPPPTATEDGSLTDSTFFGAGSGAKSKLKLKRQLSRGNTALFFIRQLSLASKEPPALQNGKRRSSSKVGKNDAAAVHVHG